MMEKAEILKVRLDNLQRRFDAALSQIAEVIGDHDLTDREKIEAIDARIKVEDVK